MMTATMMVVRLRSHHNSRRDAVATANVEAGHRLRSAEVAFEAIGGAAKEAKLAQDLAVAELARAAAAATQASRAVAVAKVAKRLEESNKAMGIDLGSAMTGVVTGQ